MQPTAHLHALRGRPAQLVLGSLLTVLVTVGIVLAFNWPFTEAKFIRDLEHFSSCEVRVQRFHEIYLPHPGYIAEGVTFFRRSNGRAVEMSSVRKLECIASWAPIIFFQHRVSNFRLEGLHVLIPAPVPAAIPFYPSMKSRTTLTTLTADGAVLDIAARHPGGRPLRFEFHKLVLGEVKKDKSISLETMLHIPLPPGDLRVRARFGPLVKGRLGETPLWGSYDLERADLENTKAIGGMVNSDGSFRGKLAQCDVRGKVRIDDFEVKRTRHPVTLYGRFNTTLNALKGDVAIRSTQVHFLRTELQAVGAIHTIAHENGKTQSIEVTSDKARIEDLLRLFTAANTPALRGPISLRANITVPPGPQDFLRKLQLNGTFKIPQAEFLHANSRKSVNKLSNRARGHKSKDDENAGEDIPSRLNAQVAVKNGTATLSDANFGTWGAAASGGGTYNLLTQEINLRGKLAIEASLSKAAGGLKSILLIPLDPLFKKGNAGAVLPFHVTGTYSHPAFHVSLAGRK
jgi:hypothetical protein